MAKQFKQVVVNDFFFGERKAINSTNIASHFTFGKNGDYIAL